MTSALMTSSAFAVLAKPSAAVISCGSEDELSTMALGFFEIFLFFAVKSRFLTILIFFYLHCQKTSISGCKSYTLFLPISGQVNEITGKKKHQLAHQ